MTTLLPHPPGVPAPTPTPLSVPFWEGCERHELRFQRCVNGHPVFQPATLCRMCASAELAWETSAGVGRIYSFTTIWRPPDPTFAVPYVAAIVELDEGYRMLANIVGCDHTDVVVGARVRVEFHPLSDAITFPYFVLAGPA
jgi:uncharacterized OB-fold protein